MRDSELYNRERIQDIYHLLSVRATHTPDKTIFMYKEKKRLVEVTCSQFWLDVNRLCLHLKERGLQGGRVALLGENSYHWIISYFAIIFSGAVVIPLDKDQNPAELAKLLKRCPADLIICSWQYRDVVDSLRANGVEVEPLIMREIPKIIEGISQTHFEEPDVDPDAVCTIIFTSGTTGEPKGVMLTQRGISSDALNCTRSVWLSGTSLLTLPLHHAFGFTVAVLSAYVCGGPIYISKSLRTFSKDLKEIGPANLVVVPLYVESMYKNIWKSIKDQGKEDKVHRAIEWTSVMRRFGIDLRYKLFRSIHEELGGNLRSIVCGGAFLDQRYIDGMDAFGFNIYNGYGITECSPVVSVNQPRKRRAHSVGQPLPSCEVRIIEGEICVRGDNVMEGYFDDEKSTKEVMPDDWFRTGDLGHFDGDGYLYITGRKKNLIILSNGKNVSAEELENELINIDNVEEVVVRQEDESIVAEIYADVRAGIEEAIDVLNHQLPPYKRISKVVYRLTEFERTTTHKIKRNYNEGKKTKD